MGKGQSRGSIQKEAEAAKTDLLKHLVETKILLDSKGDSFLLLNELLLFPHLQDGYHIWEAGIILGRFIVQNIPKFDGKSILELGTGVGIGGIAALKYTKCTKMVLSDYNEGVLQNAYKNVAKNDPNGTAMKITEAQNLDWRNYSEMEEGVYDVIIGSDIIYSGCPLEDLANLINRVLKASGAAYIIIPSQRQAAPHFLDLMKSFGTFEIQCADLKGEEYTCSPMTDTEMGNRTYPGLYELEFFVYTFTKIKPSV